MKQDRLLYVSRCTCGELGVVMRKDNAVQFYCISCRVVKPVDIVKSGQMYEDIYPDYYKSNIVRILKMIDPAFKAKPTMTFMSLVLALVGFIDLFGVKIKCYQQELKVLDREKQGDLFIDRWRKTRFGA